MVFFARRPATESPSILWRIRWHVPSRSRGGRSARHPRARNPGRSDADRAPLIFGREVREEKVINVAKPYVYALRGREHLPEDVKPPVVPGKPAPPEADHIQRAECTDPGATHV